MVGEIKDYPCSYGTKEESIVGVVKACNLTVPEVYKDGEQMAEPPMTALSICPSTMP